MSDYLVIGGIIAVIYALIKILEIRMSKDDPKPLKVIVKETILVYICAILGIFIFNQVNPLKTGGGPTSAFTGKPEF